MKRKMLRKLELKKNTISNLGVVKGSGSGTCPGPSISCPGGPGGSCAESCEQGHSGC